MLIILYFPERSFPWPYALVKFSKKISSGNHNYNIEHVFLGDSFISSAVIPLKIKNSIVIGVPDGHLPEIYYTMDTFLKNNTKPKSVFIQIPSILFYRSSFYRNLKYGSISCKNAFEIFSTNKKLKSRSLTRRAVHFYPKAIAICLKWPFFYGSEIRRFLFQSQNIKIKKELLESVFLTKGHIDLLKIYNFMGRGEKEILFKRRKSLITNEQYLPFHNLPLQITFLEKLIKLLNKSQVKIFFVSDAKRKDRVTGIHFLKKVYPEIPIFIAKKVFLEDFIDVNHLSYYGAYKYTSDLKDFMEKHSL